MTLSDRRPMVAIDPTTRGLAFVCFASGKPVEWGERLARTDRDALRIIDWLIDGYAPRILLLEDAEGFRSRRRVRMRKLLGLVASHAQRPGLRVITVARNDVRQAWAACRVTRKETIAAVIAAAFPELGALVPLRRATGGSEDPRANVFDAASLAIYASQRSHVVP